MINIARLVFLMFFVSVSFSEAATIYIDPGVATLNRGDAITASVRIMPDSEAGECINAIDAVVTYTDNIQPVDVSIGKSIFNVWVESPTINKEDHTITFAGGIPNGYCGRVEGDPRLTNIIAEIIFRSPGMQIGGSDDDQVRIDFGPETQALLNDGQGTQAPLRMLGATFMLDKSAGATISDDWRELVRSDNIPPEQFSITLLKDDTTYGGRNYITFSTPDKQTGISHYEVMEEPVLQFGEFNWGGVGSPWVRVDINQYELKDQSLNSIIRVKAIDKAGNEYMATLIPDESLRKISKNSLYTYIFIGFSSILFIVVFFISFRYFKKRRKVTLDESEDKNEIE